MTIHLIFTWCHVIMFCVTIMSCSLLRLNCIAANASPWIYPTQLHINCIQYTIFYFCIFNLEHPFGDVHFSFHLRCGWTRVFYECKKRGGKCIAFGNQMKRNSASKQHLEYSLTSHPSPKLHHQISDEFHTYSPVKKKRKKKASSSSDRKLF